MSTDDITNLPSSINLQLRDWLARKLADGRASSGDALITGHISGSEEVDAIEIVEFFLRRDWISRKAFNDMASTDGVLYDLGKVSIAKNPVE